VTAPTPEGNSDRQAGWVAAFYPHWVAATGVAMVLLLAYGWVLLPGQPLSIRAIYLAGPAYMAHQIEEHRGDRFLAYVNRRQFGGRPALTPLISLLVNIPGVWGTNLIALYAALRWHPGWGLTAVWLMIVNGVVHLIGALRWREYHPGVATAALLFLPGGLAALAAIPASHVQQITGLGAAIVLHLVLLAWVSIRVQRMGGKQAAPGSPMTCSD